MKRILLLLGFSIFLFSGYSQSSDTTSIVIEEIQHSPKKATLLSLAVPGLGQAYNKKYWKIPIVYGMIGTSLFFAISEQRQFADFRDAYISRVDDDTMTVDTKYQGRFTDQNLLDLADGHRQNRDLFFVLTGVAYALNVLDAAVDAHLFYFDVSDDIAGTLKPNFRYLPSQQVFSPSLTLSLKFAKKDHKPRY